MNICTARILMMGVTITSVATLSTITKPLLAAEPDIEEIELLSVGEHANPQLSSSLSFSTRAADLLAEVDVDLDKFCQNYPYNSRCRDRTNPTLDQPQTETETETEEPTQYRDNTSQSERKKSGWAIAPEASTLGLGGSVVRRITPQINGRIGVNGFGFGVDIEDTDATYDGDLNLFNVSTLADFYPLKNSGFRVSAGLVFNNNNLEGTATPTNIDGNEQIEIGDETFEVSELSSVDADIDITNSVAPYLGIGGGNPVAAAKGLGFWWNLGIVFGGSPDVTITPNIADGVPESTRNEIEAAVERETEDLEDEIDFLSIYPVVSLGLSYQF